MIVAITGGTGFIGRKLVERHLAVGDRVRILTRQSQIQPPLPDNVQLYQNELSASAEPLVSFVDGADVLYHCAGQVTDRNRMHAVHVGGTANLLRAAAGRIGRWVQLSSVGIYGPYSAGNVTEQTLPRPVGTYEQTKWQSDELVVEAAQDGGFSYAILRPSNVYGPEMRNQSLFQLITMINAGWFFFVGKPGALANYIHVANVVKALMKCGRDPRAIGEIFNLSDQCTLEELVTIVQCTLGRPKKVPRIPAPIIQLVLPFLSIIPRMPLNRSRIGALTGRATYSVGKIQAQLDYTHQITIQEGIRQLTETWKMRTGSIGSASLSPVTRQSDRSC
jgi:nucleoside-diphosphate-sugar epimerase